MAVLARRGVRERQAWRVSIPAHTIRATTIGGSPRPGRYVVPASERLQFEEPRHVALTLAVTAAHVAAGVPPWRPYLRETARLASLERTVATASGGADRG